jgi:hypothetical protein
MVWLVQNCRSKIVIGEDHNKFQPIRGFYGPWQPCWITDRNESNNSWLDHANEHSQSCAFLSHLLKWFSRRRLKCLRTTMAGRQVMAKAHMTPEHIFVTHLNWIYIFFHFSCSKWVVYSSVCTNRGSIKEMLERCLANFQGTDLCSCIWWSLLHFWVVRTNLFLSM